MCNLLSIGNGFARPVCLLASAMFALALVTGRVDAGTSPVPLYTLTDLGVPPGSADSAAAGLNDSGQVVGTSTYLSHGFLYSNGSMHDLGLNAQEQGINARGQVVGAINTNTSGFHPSLYSDGVMHDLGTLGTQGVAYGVNASGQVVGIFSGRAGGSGFLYSGGVMREITPGGGTALAINDAGQVVGEFLVGFDFHPYLYSEGTFHDLGGFGGQGEARAISPNGLVAGYSQTSDGDGHAFLYSGGALRDLGTLFGVGSGAEGVNEAGQVVGSSGLPRAVTVHGTWVGAHAFVYTYGTMYDLNNLIEGPSGYVITDAAGINASGQIAATAIAPSGRIHAVLLTPGAVGVPLPPAAWAALIALPLLLIVKRFVSFRTGKS